MAWNNNSGGPWGGGGNSGGPWGGGGGNRGGGGGPFGSRRPPDMEDVIRKGQERLRNLIPGGFGSYKGIALIVLAAAVIWLVTGFFRVQPNQQAIQLVFGKPYGKPVEPGLHYNLPSPIGTVIIVNVQDQRRTVIGSRNAQDRSSPYSRGPRPTSTENLMLTGDENIVDIEFAVLWQIKDVFKYAFDVRNPEENVRAGAEAAMREVIGKSNLQYAQTEGRGRIEQDTRDLLQRMLDEYGLGVRISQVQLLRVDPPQEVIAAFRDVQAARADKEKSINEANTYRNQVLPRAKGEAESIIQRAEAYKAQTIARASGDAQRFDQVYTQWAKAKDITTERLYLDTMEEVLRNVNKVVIDKNASGTGGVLPYLPLPELKPASRRAAEPAPARRSPAARRRPRERRDEQPFDHRADCAGRLRLPVDPDILYGRSDQAGAGAPVRRHRRRAQGRARPLCQDSADPGHPAHRPPPARLRSRGVRDHRRRPEAPRGRRLRAVQDRGGQAVRPDRARRRAGVARPARFADQFRDPRRAEFGAVARRADRQARKLDERDHPAGQQQDQGVGRRYGRRAHQAGRSSAGQLAVGLQSHEDRP